ncbi:MAG: 23S rRNA (adenine(2503)-C(2))-methyltransferase RlmN [Bacteroidales bacterium]|nr:23S rRNA (adenine(2503)-C(2))-methyltransferase RlmN [Bacteroidales bacterium]
MNTIIYNFALHLTWYSIMQEELFGKTIHELEEIVASGHLPSYTALQISQWLYQKKVQSIAGMTNLSKAVRESLSGKYAIHTAVPVQEQISKDGTKKYLFPVHRNRHVETVFIPEKNRNTLCVSTQIGCKMGCVFCMTGKQGFQGNLSSGEILNQFVSVPESGSITNIVFMGMGEPLDNPENVLKALEILSAPSGFGMSPSRITVSTIGLLPVMNEFIRKTRCHLAVSLNSPFPEERRTLMPVEKMTPVHDIVALLKEQSLERQRRISFEYVMFRGMNDTIRHIRGLTRLLNGLKCRINLIRYHPLPGVSLQTSDESTIRWFGDRLNEKGLLTTIRTSRGQDIMAACGMLSTHS